MSSVPTSSGGSEPNQNNQSVSQFAGQSYVPLAKVDSVLEYLAFSGTPLFVSLLPAENGGTLKKIDKPFHVLDVEERDFSLESPKVTNLPPTQVRVEISFGYKRKRAQFETTLESAGDSQWRLKKPERIELTNLRRNPRILVARDAEFNLSLQVKTSVGPVTITRAEPYEMSQLGMSLFIDRAQGLILPGDAIESLVIEQKGIVSFKTTGVVSRVNMHRSSERIPGSYEVVVIFRNNRKDRVESVQRATKRTPVLDDKPCFFSAEHPLFPGRRIEGQVIEISTSGFSCMLEKTQFPIVPGMRFSRCQLQLPHRNPREFIFEVSHAQFKSDGETNQFRIGGEFVTASVELIKDISAYAQEASDDMVRDLTEADLDLLWEFMFETDFIYRNKRKQIQGNSREILKTYHRLLSTDNPLVKKLAFKEDDEIKGHLSTIRFYDQTWLIQHLNALKTSGPSAAQGVLKWITNFFNDQKSQNATGAFYNMAFYRPDNLYPSIMFGETARMIGDANRCVQFDFLFGQPDDELSTNAPNFEVDSIASVNRLVDLLVEQGYFPWLRAVGLSNPDPLNLKISGLYEKHGLFRARHIVEAVGENSTVFALCEVSSPGLNLSELTNSITLFISGDPAEAGATLVRPIIEYCRKKYFDSRGISPVILGCMDLKPLGGVKWAKVYSCWILNLEAVPDFERCTNEIAGNIKKFIYERKLRERIDDPLKKNYGAA